MGGVGKVIGDVVGGVTGASAAADAAKQAAVYSGQAAEAQQAQAKQNFNFINQQGQQLQSDVMKQAGQYSVQQLNALDQSYSAATQNLSNQQKLMSSIDPTLMEASQQALKLLRGESASSLAPLQNQQAMQRQTLVNNLRAQGISETSSAGINALNRFDSQAALNSNNAQQQQLGTLLGTTLGSRQDLNQSVNTIAGIGNSYGNLGLQQANVLGGIGTARLGALSGAGQNLINTAGAQFTQGVLQNQAEANYRGGMANQLMGIGGTALGAYLGGGLGAAAGGGIAGGGGGGGMPSTSSGYWAQNPYAS